MKPVAARATFWLIDNLSAGRAISLRPAATRHHFIKGAQKNTVLGPAGWFINDWNFEPVAAAAAPDILEEVKDVYLVGKLRA